mgnify:CR=1 FL=1
MAKHPKKTAKTDDDDVDMSTPAVHFTLDEFGKLIISDDAETIADAGFFMVVSPDHFRDKASFERIKRAIDEFFLSNPWPAKG